LDDVERILNQASQSADLILSTIEQEKAGQFMRLNMAALVTGQLEELGYAVDSAHSLDNPPLSQESWRIFGRREVREGEKAREQIFEVVLNHDGTVWFDVTRGYKRQECDDLKLFIQGLQKKGVQGLWEPVYSAEQAAAHFRAMLSQEGYVFFEELSDEGIVITLVKDGHREAGATIAWNGETTGDVKRETTSVPGIEGSYIERLNAMRKEEIKRAQQLAKIGMTVSG
jgi:hypothetical protein